MASISTNKQGNRRIQFVAAGGERKSIWLGRVPIKTAEAFKTRVEYLQWSVAHSHPLDGETAKWLADIDAELCGKLAAVGLCEPRGSDTLGPFMEGYINGRTDVKPATKEIWGQGKASLLEFFGAACAMRKITPGKADEYKLKLLGDGLATFTVRKRLQFAKMICRAAVRRNIITSNPFDDVSVKAVMPDRFYFVTHEQTAKLLEACPDHHWRAIVALARFGGLRCPSEVLSLKWDGIYWDSDRMRVWSPKTEHHPGKDSRVVPICAELRKVLDESDALAPAGAVYVVDERFRAATLGSNGWRNCNLRTTFEKIVERAGLDKWPRLFHNLRSSRQTEWSDQFPSKVVCSWMGNSEEIANKHYNQVTEEHFARAVGCVQIVAQTAPAEAGQRETNQTENCVLSE